MRRITTLSGVGFVHKPCHVGACNTCCADFVKILWLWHCQSSTEQQFSHNVSISMSAIVCKHAPQQDLLSMPLANTYGIPCYCLCRSMAESYAPPDWKGALRGNTAERSGMQNYGAAKLFNIMLAKEYSRRLKVLPAYGPHSAALHAPIGCRYLLSAKGMSSASSRLAAAFTGAHHHSAYSSSALCYQGAFQ